jgi:cytoskeleton protein RodZ
MGAMPAPPQIQPPTTSIGLYLQWARAQKGLELSDVEAETKIRRKYLQALESEDWDVMPSPAYTRGFLATYARVLDVDADSLVDEYRRQAETDEPTGNLSAYGDPVLEGRRRIDAPRGPRGAVIAVLAGVVVVIVATLWILGNTGDESSNPPAGHHAKGGHQGARKTPQAGGQAVPLKLHTKTGMTVCLVGDNGEALIDSQTLPAGASQSFDATKYRLDVNTGGTVKLTVASAVKKLEPTGPASYRVSGGKVSKIPYKGRSCP